MRLRLRKLGWAAPLLLIFHPILGGSGLIAQNRVSAATSNSMQVVGPTFLAISVADLEASTQWYGRVFQAATLRDVQAGDGRGRARILRNGPLVIELIERVGSVSRSQLLPGGAHDFDLQGHVKAGIFVESAETLHTDWRGFGVEMDERVLSDSLLDVLTFVIRDPDGNRIQIFEDVSR